MEEQEFLTLKTYEKHSKKLLECAKTILSHLKAMELREQLRNFKGDKLNVLTKYISKSDIDFNLTEEKFKIYQRYIDEMESRIRSNI